MNRLTLILFRAST